MLWKTFEVFTLFPTAISGFLREGLLGKALRDDLVAVHCTDYRDFSHDLHRSVDDAPYGGGPGMVLKAPPVVAALEAVTAARGPMHRVLLTPSAPTFDQRVAERLAQLPRVGLLCGRYEGIDDRVREGFVDECLSLGDFVLNGGEVAALAIIEAVVRLGPGVLGNAASAVCDSFAAAGTGSWLEAPHYTRPPEFRGLPVPPALRSGDHTEVARWRAVAAWHRTWALRSDLRPKQRLAASAPVYVAAASFSADERADLAQLPGVRGVLSAADVADAKTLRRQMRRRHGAGPTIIVVTTSAADASDCPVATSGPALVDLLALWGDLSAPVILCLAMASDGTNTPVSEFAGLGLPTAVFALNAKQCERAALALAQRRPIRESSRPQAGGEPRTTLAAAALIELCEPASSAVGAPDFCRVLS